MLWIWLMALITLFLLGWFAYKLFSGGTPKLVVSGGDHGHGHGDEGSGHGHDGSTGSSDSSESSSESDKAAGSASASGSAASASGSSATGAIAAAGAAAVAGTAAVSAMGSSRSANKPGPQNAANPIVYENVTSGSDISNSGNGSSGHANGVTAAISSEDASSVREMIKILNLRESDASRLGIDKAQFNSLWQGGTDGVDASALSSVRSRLQNMMS